MKIIRAEHLGMCFGVRDAIELASTEARNRPVTILGELVHNETVLRSLQESGVKMSGFSDGVETKTVMITAHGASEKRVAAVRARGHEVLEATCPLVKVAHRAVSQLAKDGYHVVIIGKRDHVEVRGLTEDLEDFDVILTEADIYQLPPRARFGVAAQTTQPIERARALVRVLRIRFPESEVRFVDTVCQPTKQRQKAAVEIAQLADVVLVIGGSQSNNTRELVSTCKQHCGRVHHVQTVTELIPAWFAEARSVGITAGTSTPDSVIQEIENWLQSLAEQQKLGQHFHGSVPEIN
jgi:4-hydroxy-3-methylbut-2-enyl diphosphate reductase